MGAPLPQLSWAVCHGDRGACIERLRLFFLHCITLVCWPGSFFLVLMVVCSFDFPLEPTELFSFYALISLQNSKIVDKTIRRTNMLFTIIVLHYFHSKYSGAVLVRGQGGMNFSCKEYYPTYKKS